MGEKSATEIVSRPTWPLSHKMIPRVSEFENCPYNYYLKDGGLEDALSVDECLRLAVARRDGHDALGVRQDAVPREQHRTRRQQHALTHRLERKINKQQIILMKKGIKQRKFPNREEWQYFHCVTFISCS